MLRNVLSSLKEAGQILHPAVRGASCINAEQIRTTVVVERYFKPPLGKIGQMPRLKRCHKVLKFVERVHDSPTPKITCILTQYVRGLGMEGDIVEVKRSVFRNKLYPGLMAVYASPENLAEVKKTKEEEEGPKMTASGRMTLEKMQLLHLRVPMNGDKDWIVSKTNVKVALRNIGIEVKESCITLPKDAITEPQEFTFTITVNQQESVEIRGTAYNVGDNVALPDLPPIWSRSNKKKMEKHLK